MVAGYPLQARARVDGKFFRLGEKKFHVKGVSYGPFALNEQGDAFVSPEQTARDFTLIRELGANVVRTYAVPPRWLLDLAAGHQLRVMMDIPWAKDHCFMDSESLRSEARQAVRQAVRACQGHAAVFAYCIANEIPSEIVRWSGAQRVTDFLEELVDVAKTADRDCLCTFANYPPTEFLHPQNVDFVSFNVYLHQQRAFESYLGRLQMQAGDKPLVLSEFGIDSLREGESHKCEMLSWQIESAFRGGLAGTIVFSFTDDWVKAGRRIEDWTMGLTTLQRKPKDSYFAVQQLFQTAPEFPLKRYPRVSVVVACYNGARTLKACLESLETLHYPDYEVILVDDGSTDATPQIAARFAGIRYIRQDNHGLSVARNTGIAAATGEIVAFTDADCRADEGWLYFLVGDLLANEFVGIGGHNFLPVEDSPVAAAVMVSPGGPAHVMVSDREAEHIPGCNMAVYKWALEEIGCFDPIFRIAGDDVDLCWRLQQHGYKIGFSPAGFVWHYRRSTVAAYLKQQQGYGEAEALLARKHPEYFNSFGGSIWRGRIYTVSQFAVVTRPPIIYHGVFGTGFFQALYAPQPALTLMLCTSLEYHVLITLPLMVLSVSFQFLWPVALTSFLISVGVCMAAAAQANLPRGRRKLWSRPLIALLFFLQPIVRGWSRYHGRLVRQPTPPGAYERLEKLPRRQRSALREHLYYLADPGIDRVTFLTRVQTALDEQSWPSKGDTGWGAYDIEVFGTRWSSLALTVVTEDFADGRRLFRCRINTGWSLAAQILFWAVFGAELLLIGLLAHEQPWLWMLLLTMPVLGWYLEQEQNNLQRLIAAFLDEVAAECGFVKADYHRRAEKFVPVGEAADAFDNRKPGGEN